MRNAMVNLVVGLTLLLTSLSYGLISDINLDGKVNLVDLSMLADHWMVSDCGPCRGRDLTGDGNIDLNDLLVLSEEWLLEEIQFPQTVELVGLDGFVLVDALGLYEQDGMAGEKPLYRNVENGLWTIQWYPTLEVWMLSIPTHAWRGPSNINGPVGVYVPYAQAVGNAEVILFE